MMLFCIEAQTRINTWTRSPLQCTKWRNKVTILFWWVDSDLPMFMILLMFHRAYSYGIYMPCWISPLKSEVTTALFKSRSLILMPLWRFECMNLDFPPWRGKNLFLFLWADSDNPVSLISKQGHVWVPCLSSVELWWFMEQLKSSGQKTRKNS